MRHSRWKSSAPQRATPTNIIGINASGGERDPHLRGQIRRPVSMRRRRPSDCCDAQPVSESVGRSGIQEPDHRHRRLLRALAALCDFDGSIAGRSSGAPVVRCAGARGRIQRGAQGPISLSANPDIARHIDRSVGRGFFRTIGRELIKPIDQLGITATLIDEAGEAIAAVTPALGTSNAKHIELADKITEYDCAVAGHA